MHVDERELQVLEALQALDVELIRARKKFAELPQRELIVDIRKKKQAVEAKRAAVEPMDKEANAALAKLIDEDERLSIRAAETQEKIDQTGGDYRSIESLTRDLNGITKRRTTLETAISEAGAKCDQTAAVMAQIDTALSGLAAQEEAAIASFQKEGGALNAVIAAGDKRRAKLAEALSPELASRYEAAARRCGGIGLAKLESSACSVCRASIVDGKLLQVKGEAPLSTCPSCKRLMVVE